MLDHAERARELFMQGYNCAQSVACAFCDLTGLSVDESARMASSFGAGFGRLREVCGTVSGASLVLGILEGYADPGDYQAKKLHYARVQAFARRFREENGSIICRELLKGVDIVPGDAPEERTAEYYQRRPCPMLAYKSAKLLEELLSEIQSEKDQP